MDITIRNSSFSLKYWVIGGNFVIKAVIILFIEGDRINKGNYCQHILIELQACSNKFLDVIN